MIIDDGVGGTFWAGDSDTIPVPNNVYRIVFRKQRIESYGLVPYYTQGPGVWYGANGDYLKLLRYVVTHELGHSIGIKEENSNKTIMYETVPIDPLTGQAFYDPAWLNDFSSTDKSKMTIKYKEIQ